MRNLSIFIGLVFLTACTEQASNEVATDQETSEEVAVTVAAEDLFFGDKIDGTGAIGIKELYAQLETADSVQVKMTSTINQTCSNKGCWMTVDLGNEEEMMVQFKDYGFFVPVEGMEGKTTVFEGYAFNKTLSAEELQHLAKDAGEDEATIAAITEPKESLSFLASGVIINN